MRWALVAIASVGLTAGCDRLFKLDSYPDAAAASGDGTRIEIPPPCTPSSFDGQVPYTMFGGKPASALTVSYDTTLFIVEVKGSPNALFTAHASTSDEVPIPPPVPGEEMAEPTLDPEGNVLYARDKTAGDTIVAYARVTGNTFAVSPILAIPTGHRAGNQTLDLGGFRRMVVQYDPGTMVFVFHEYQGSPTTGWTLTGTDTTAMDLTGSTTPVIEDPSLSVDGLNLTYTVDGNVYFSHRTAIGMPFGRGTKLLTGSFSSPVLGNSCRTLFVVDKGSQTGRRYMTP